MARKAKLNEFSIPGTDDHQISLIRSELYRNTKYAMAMLNEIRPHIIVDKVVCDKICQAADYLEYVYSHIEKLEEPVKLAPTDIDKKTGKQILNEEPTNDKIKESLMKVVEFSMKLFKSIQIGKNIDSWVAMKLAKASELISSAKHYMEYKAFETHTKDTFNESRGKRMIKKTNKMERVMESARAKVKIRSLMEDQELDQAETILAAKDVSSRVQDMAEDVAKMSVEDLMSLVDTMRDQFGTESAKGFNDTVKPALEELLSTVEKTKATIDSAIETLRQGGVPAPASDLASQGSFDQQPEAAPEVPEAPEAPEGEAAGEQPTDEFGGTQASAGPAEEPMGRMKKESAENKKAAILEAKKQNEKKARIAMLRLDIKKLNSEQPKGFKAKIEKLEKEIEDLNESVQINEKWGVKMKTPEEKKGMFDGWTLARLKKAKKALMDKESRTKAEQTKVREINFAIRAKQKNRWGKINESAPPGFPYSLEKKLLKQYKDHPEKAYATMWKIHNQKKESIENNAKILENAIATKDKLVENFNKHKAIFKKKLNENIVTDPLNVGYGVEGEVIIQEIDAVNQLICRLQQTIACLVKQAIAELRAKDEACATIAQITAVKDATPYGAVWVNGQGDQEAKFFESESTRSYWLSLNKDIIKEHKLINPNHLEKRISQLSKTVEK